MVETRDDEGRTPLMLAADGRDLAQVTKLLAAGADVKAVDQEQRSALFHAVYDVDVFRKLVEAGADVRHKDDYGMTVLAFTAQMGRPDVLRVLLETDAKGDLEDHDEQNDYTPLLHAVDSAYCLETVQALLDAGASTIPTYPYRQKRTALHQAAHRQEPAIVRALLKAGADPNALDEDGRRPVDLARMEDRAEVVALLAEAGGDPGAGARALPSELLDPATATVAELLERLETTPASAAAEDPEAILEGLKTRLDLYELPPAFEEYVRETAAVDTIESAFGELWGIERALPTLTTFREAFGTEYFGDAPFPALRVGRHAGHDLWVLVRFVLSGKRNGWIVALSREAFAQRIKDDVAEAERWGGGYDVDTYTEVLQSASPFDIVDLLFLGDALAREGVDATAAVKAVFRWDEQVLERTRQEGTLAFLAEWDA